MIKNYIIKFIKILFILASYLTGVSCTTTQQDFHFGFNPQVEVQLSQQNNIINMSILNNIGDIEQLRLFFSVDDQNT
ncbi:hypothetical protein TTHERM_01085460 (macronuclear) [Tetrahymena thermophila SB210]|uniref:Transmembrane protein n=1 Tax=Tetrahymena thermophila (strain SB210) TaxID=312017 RepID=Q22BS3_TETTS|nr:hypothetical protein TTHERM_01085460 [Tetrahymena thermophila SB210]EAR82716.2 hypothetical protein TTHERM_01085460 [Tetrahymena thermophila SB210]|eukprot:XP_001030379.2 hypothetical protein TTHERM_01085460 [Tetrahymena thermophila SB210]